jgi:hypothetical protein
MVIKTSYMDALFVSPLELGTFTELAVFMLAHLFFAPLYDTTHRFTSLSYFEKPRMSRLKARFGWQAN